MVPNELLLEPGELSWFQQKLWHLRNYQKRLSFDEEVTIIRRHIDRDDLVCAADRNLEGSCTHTIIDHFSIAPWLWKRNRDRLVRIGEIEEHHGNLLRSCGLSSVSH